MKRNSKSKLDSVIGKNTVRDMARLNFRSYQKASEETAIYPHRKSPFNSLQKLLALNYVLLGLGSEVGELQGKVKKVMRDKNGVFDLDDLHNIGAEVGDVIWYLSQLATELDLHLNILAFENLKKLRSRKERGVLQGSGDAR